MNKKNLVLILVCAAISVILTVTLAPFDADVISYSTVLNIEIALFSVSLTIVALLITILDKYKERVTDQSTWAKNSTLILKELCENTIALLVLIALLFGATIFKPLLMLIPKFDIMTIILFSIILSICACFDTTISVYLLILNLKNVLTTSTTSIKNISKRELYLVEAYRLLNEKHRTNIDDMIKALNLEQQVNENNK